MPRGARIAGWVYFPIHVAVLPLTIGVLLMAVLGEREHEADEVIQNVARHDAVSGLAKVDYKRMIAVAVLMAPLVEECLFRGVVFGTIRPHSRFWAYAMSIALFSLYHVWQYVVMYGDPKLLLSALAYVPVSAALTFCYEQTRSIWPPVFFHMCINALSLAVLAG